MRFEPTIENVSSSISDKTESKNILLKQYENKENINNFDNIQDHKSQIENILNSCEHLKITEQNNLNIKHHDASFDCNNFNKCNKNEDVNDLFNKLNISNEEKILQSKYEHDLEEVSKKLSEVEIKKENSKRLVARGPIKYNTSGGYICQDNSNRKIAPASHAIRRSVTNIPISTSQVHFGVLGHDEVENFLKEIETKEDYEKRTFCDCSISDFQLVNGALCRCSATNLNVASEQFLPIAYSNSEHTNLDLPQNIINEQCFNTFSTVAVNSSCLNITGTEQNIQHIQGRLPNILPKPASYLKNISILQMHSVPNTLPINTPKPSSDGESFLVATQDYKKIDQSAMISNTIANLAIKNEETEKISSSMTVRIEKHNANIINGKETTKDIEQLENLGFHDVKGRSKKSSKIIRKSVDSIDSGYERSPQNCSSPEETSSPCSVETYVPKPGTIFENPHTKESAQSAKREYPFRERMKNSIDDNVMDQYWLHFCLIKDEEISSLDKDGDTHLMVLLQDYELEKFNAIFYCLCEHLLKREKSKEIENILETRNRNGKCALDYIEDLPAGDNTEMIKNYFVELLGRLNN